MIPREILKMVQQIQIRTSHLVTGALAGKYHSVFKGQGMEFEEVREYQAGDEIKMIDWNVTARMGHPYIKRFVEERELTVMLLVDISASGNFGSIKRFKSEIATEICALLAFSAIKNNDKVGLITFTDRIEKFVPPKKGKKHVLRVIRELLYNEGEMPENNYVDVKPSSNFQIPTLKGGQTSVLKGSPGDFETSKDQDNNRNLGLKPVRHQTDINVALEFLNKVAIRRTVTFLVSDFLATRFERALRLSNKRHDIIAITIIDPRELELPDIGFVELEDAETGEILLIDTSDKNLRNSFEQTNLRNTEERARLFRSMDVDEIVVRVDRPYIEPIAKFFRLREKRSLTR